MRILLNVEVDKEAFAENRGVPESEVEANLPNVFVLMSDALTWHVKSAELLEDGPDRPSDVVKVILSRPPNGAGGGIPLTRGEVAMLFFDRYAGDGAGLLDIRSQGYGDDDDWDGLTREDVFSCDEGEDAVFVWSKWEPLELWPKSPEGPNP